MKRERSPIRLSILRSRGAGLDDGLSEGMFLLARSAAVWSLLLFLSLAAQSATLHVSGDGNDVDGLTWETAFTAIGGALTVSASGDEIWVASGTYNETVEMVTGVALYGGFAVGDRFPTDRNPDKNPVVISGDSDARPVIAVRHAPSVLLDGLNVTQGYTGIHAERSADLHITNCRVTSHSRDGIYLRLGSCSLSRCIACNNSRGGLWTSWASQLTIVDSVFVNNECGMILNCGDSCTVDRCIASLNWRGCNLTGSAFYSIADSVIAGNTE